MPQPAAGWDAPANKVLASGRPVATLVIVYTADADTPAGEPHMATNRSRRLRKKLCVDEFQELGFELSFQYKEGAAAEVTDAFMRRFTDQLLAPNGLSYAGCDEYGFVCLGRRGSVSEEQRGLVDEWLRQQPELASFTISALMDAWYPGQPVKVPR